MTAPVTINEPLIQLLEDWKRRCTESQRNHNLAAQRLLHTNRWIGTPAVILSAVLGTGVLATAQAQVNPYWRVAAGLIAVAAAVLTALQVHLDYSERAERHRSAATRFLAVRREIEQIVAFKPSDQAALQVALDQIRDRMDGLAEQSPALPPDLWITGQHKDVASS